MIDRIRTIIDLYRTKRKWQAEDGERCWWSAMKWAIEVEWLAEAKAREQR